MGRKTRLSTDYLLAQLMGDTSVWRFAVEDQIFALGVADVTGDGEQEVIACSWDGMTYIFNYKKELVKFHFGNPVCAFCVGKSSLVFLFPLSLFSFLSSFLYLFRFLILFSRRNY